MSKTHISKQSSCAIEGAMLALADQVPEWKEFPKGLHVMLVDQDLDVIDDLKFKLDSCGYSVTCYSRGEEALQALEDKNKIFHVVVVDATRNDTFDGFAVVAAAKHLTTIMMASTENMNIMMQGIAAGASEFLQKPLSEERLKNIWQHVVRKALVSGHLGSPTALSPLTSDLKFKATLKPNVGSGTSDSRHHAAEMKRKYEDHVACNADKLDETDEMCGTQEELFFQEDIQHHIQSNFSLVDKDGKESCDAFLCLTPPQLENSFTRIGPTDHDDNMELVGASLMPASQEFNMKTHLKEMHDYFDDCENYLHIKSEVDEAVNNSVILNDLFDTKSQINAENFLVMSTDDQKGIANEEFIDAKLCAVLQLDDIPGSLDDIALAGDILDDTTDQSLSMGLDCPDDEEFQEVDDEEALLLTNMVEVHRSSKSHVGSSNDSIYNHDNMHQHDSRGTASCPVSGSGVSEAHEDMKSRSDSDQSCSMKGSKSSNGKKKMKVDWTPELHRRFVQAVEQLGVDKAIPSRILELMGVKCLTRHNIASHLQKYRSHRRHVQAREVEAAGWSKHRRTEVAAVPAHGTRSATSAAAAPPQPAWPAVLPATTPALQPIQPRGAAAFAAPATPALHVWGHPTLDPSLHFWPAWPPPGCQLDAWGNPFYPTQRILRVPFTPMPSVANMAWPPPASKVPSVHPSKEIVVAAINEVLRNPYVPLPLGLKSPSLESVVGELQRQGISIASTASA